MRPQAIPNRRRLAARQIPTKHSRARLKTRDPSDQRGRPVLSSIAQKFCRDVNKQGPGLRRDVNKQDFDRRQRTPPLTPPRMKATSLVSRSAIGRPIPAFLSDSDNEFEYRRKPKRFRPGLDDPEEFYNRKRSRVGLDDQPKPRKVRIVRKASKQSGISIPKRGAYDAPGSRKKRKKRKEKLKKRLKQKPSSLLSGDLRSRIQRKIIAPRKLSKQARWMQKRRADTGKPEWLRWDHPPPEYRIKLTPQPQQSTEGSEKGGEDQKGPAPKEEELWVMDAWTTGINARETARKRIVGALTKHETDLKVNYVRIAIEVETALFEGLSGKAYTDQLRDVTFNLGSKRNPEFRQRILSEEINPRSIVGMKATDMASSALRKKRELSKILANEERNSEHIMNKSLRGISELKAVLGEDAANDKAD